MSGTTADPLFLVWQDGGSCGTMVAIHLMLKESGHVLECSNILSLSWCWFRGGHCVTRRSIRIAGSLCRSSLRTDEDVGDIERIVQTGSEHGLNGMVLSAGLDRLDQQSPALSGATGESEGVLPGTGVEIIPNIFSAGYGGSVLAYNRNLAAGIPVKDAPFVVKRRRSVLNPDRPVRVANGGFEQYKGNQFQGLQIP